MYANFSLIFSCFLYTFVMKYGFIEAKDIVQETSFWQSPSWKNILLLSGQAREVFYYWNPRTSWLLVEIRSVGFWCFAAFSLGVTKWQIWSDIEIMLESLVEFLKNKSIFFLQIEPIEEIWNLKQGQIIQKSYKHFLTPYTRVLDLTLSEDDLLRQMHEKWRYNIRLAIKRGVKILSVKSTKENIDIWMNLLMETTSRDGFSGNSRKYYEEFLHQIENSQLGGLYFAYFEGRVIAGGIFVFTSSRGIYYYGVSSSKKEDKRNMAPYLLQWSALCEAKHRSIPVFDFLGVADPANVSDTLWGVTDFKEKFWGNLIRLPEKNIIIIKPRLYRVFLMGRSIVKMLRRS